MRVRLCNRCPYTPRDLAGHYDAEAVLYACAKCDAIFEPYSSREPDRRRQWSTTFPSISTIPPSAAPSATDDLALSAITPGAPPCAQGNASNASRPEERTTVNGCADFAPPDHRHREIPGALRETAFRSREAAE
jgi:hypothetical protein